ncbi:MAG: methyltransferase domain-containing protein [Candidatus Woesearchaeota archaeon]
MIQRVLIGKAKTVQIEERRKPVILADETTYFIEDISKEYHCSDGVFRKENLQKINTVISTNTGREFYIIEANFIDSYKGLRKFAQTIPLKDLGFILAETGINKDSIIVDAGAGSGASAIFFARYAKHVYTYDINDKSLEQTKTNIAYYDIKNITLEKKDIYENIPLKDVDMMLIDVPEPWRAIESINKSLKVGGFVVIYCPQITQAHEFINNLVQKGNYLHLKTVEMIERDWKIEGTIVRPKSLSNIHSAFLTIMRRIN